MLQILLEGKTVRQNIHMSKVGGQKSAQEIGWMEHK